MRYATCVICISAAKVQQKFEMCKKMWYFLRQEVQENTIIGLFHYDVDNVRGAHTIRKVSAAETIDSTKSKKGTSWVKKD